MTVGKLSNVCRDCQAEQTRVAEQHHAEIDELRGEVERLCGIIHAASLCDATTGEVAYGEYDDNGAYIPPKVLPNIPQLQRAAEAAAEV